MASIFGSDRVLLYSVEPWATLGFGAPNFGENIGTLSTPIANMVDEIGTLQLFVMTHIDVMRKQPPSINTVKRICKSVNRVNAVLSGRQKEYKDQRLEATHATPAPEIWNIHPVPYFTGPIVRNYWLKEYNRLTMIALTNMMQHSDNNLPLTITSKFASDIWQYFAEIQRLVGIELLGLLPADLDKPGFVFEDTHYANYDPEKVTINMEALDTPGPILNLPTEDDLRLLVNGIPANLIAPNLKQYPVLGVHDYSGTILQPGTGTVGANIAVADAVVGAAPGGVIPVNSTSSSSAPFIGKPQI